MSIPDSTDQAKEGPCGSAARQGDPGPGPLFVPPVAETVAELVKTLRPSREEKTRRTVFPAAGRNVADPDAWRGQCKVVLSILNAGECLTQIQATHRVPTLRLGARIHTLREAGVDITTDYITVTRADGTRCTVGSYRLPTTPPPPEAVQEVA